jgi:hypothetical protein
MFRDRKKIKPLSIDIDLLGMMPKGQSLEDFIDNLVLIEASDGSPEIKVGEFPQIFEAILYLIQAIQQSRISGKPKQVAQKLKGNRKTSEFSRWHINDRIVIKEALMNLYIQLNEYPYGTSDHPEDRNIIADKVHSGNYKPNEIPKENQAAIVYQIYKYTDYENEWGNKYSNKEYYPDQRAVDNILRDMRRLFKSS